VEKLQTSDYEKARSLFTGLTDWNLIISATLDGLCPGTVLVDNEANPQTAFMSSAEGDFVVGNPDNAAFVNALHTWLFSGNREMVYLQYHPAGWEAKLPQLFRPRQPIKHDRLHYTFKQVQVDWRNGIPDGFAIERIDANLLNRPGLKIPDHVMDWIDGWGSVEAFLERGFGFGTVQNNAIVCWCIADCVSGNACEIGIHTLPEYRRRGLATLTVAATVDYCLAHDLTTIGWHCNADNYGSRGVAEKVGFEKDRDYCSHYCYADEVTHLAEMGWVAFQAGQHQKTADLYEEVFALRPDSPDFWYHLAARAWAALGDQDKALGYLNAAIDQGWSAIDDTRNCTEFTILHSTPGWQAALTRMQTNTP
jgi:GNAT superfamily N-acetyltransferase